MVAKQLAAIVDASVAVAVERQEPVVALDPAGQFGEAVGVVVEVGHRLLPSVSMPSPSRSSTSGSRRGAGTACASMKGVL